MMNHIVSRGRQWVIVAVFVGCQFVTASEDVVSCYEVDVPRLNVAEAIARLARQTGVKILFPYDIARDRQAQPVVGCFSVGEAMAIMLEGSGLVSVQSENGALTIVDR